MPHWLHGRFHRSAPATRVPEREVQDLGPRLQALRDRAGLSQRALARRCFLSHSTIVELEAGRGQAPRLSTFIHLARGPGLTLHQLLSELFPPP